MTRIIAGAAKSLRLAVPAAGARPTTDRVREALMSALQARGRLADAAVLDLFAGSGALGFESLSRGAASLQAVDNSAAALAALRRNAEQLKGYCPQAAIRLHKSNVHSFLRTAPAASGETAGVGGGRADLVFLDPPYDYPRPKLAEVFALLPPWLNEDATVIFETDKAAGQPPINDQLSLLESKAYGRSVIWRLAPAR